MKLQSRFARAFLVVSLLSFVVVGINIAALLAIRGTLLKVTDKTAPSLIILYDIKAAASRIREEAVSTILIEALSTYDMHEDAEIIVATEEEEDFDAVLAEMDRLLKIYRTAKEQAERTEAAQAIYDAVTRMSNTALSMVGLHGNSEVRTILELKKLLEESEEEFLEALQEAVEGEHSLFEKRRYESTAAVRYAALANILGIIITAVIGVLIAVRMTKHILGPVAELHASFAEVGKGVLETRVDIKTGDELEEFGNAFNSMVRLLKESRLEIDKTNAQLQKTVQEKEVLLKEIHHRVKNNLQVVSSLLRLQTHTIQDEYTVNRLEQIDLRVQAMALIHQCLYQTDKLSGINMEEYIPDLVGNLIRSLNIEEGKVLVQMDVDKIFLDIDQAVPCGLIINELLSNSMKYAFPEGRPGQIRIEFKKDDHDNEILHLCVSDNGIGLPADFDIEKTNSLGLTLIYGLADQLRGQLDLDRTGGTLFSIKFPVKEQA